MEGEEREGAEEVKIPHISRRSQTFPRIYPARPDRIWLHRSARPHCPARSPRGWNTEVPARPPKNQQIFPYKKS